MANTKKRWTADEIEILRKYYPVEGDQVCERLSGRTAKSCRIQASKKWKYPKTFPLQQLYRMMLICQIMDRGRG